MKLNIFDYIVIIILTLFIVIISIYSFPEKIAFHGEDIEIVRSAYASDIIAALYRYDDKETIEEIKRYKKTLMNEGNIKEIILSAAGDVTLGRDAQYGYINSFDNEFEIQDRDYGYFFDNVKDILNQDDLSLINLEGPLTNEEEKANKKFRFKGDPLYSKILKEGSVELVNIANNHTYDYLKKGYDDTLNYLDNEQIGYFGYDSKFITNIKGIEIGFLGYLGWYYSEDLKNQIMKDIKYLKEQNVNLIIVSFHWGNERSYYPNNIQRNLGHFIIDNGGDLVLGHHPHVIQGIEEYKGKKIVYSLGNFCFGGNKNPSDKDSFIYVHKFIFKNNISYKNESSIIPIKISSVDYRNNYQPTPQTGRRGDSILTRIRKYSEPLNADK